MKTLTSLMESVTPLYESLLSNTKNKVATAKDTLMTNKEIGVLDGTIKWKKVGKDGPVTKYEFRWDAPYTLGEVFSDYKRGKVASMVFHLNIGNGTGIVFTSGNTKDYVLWIELLDDHNKMCGGCDFFPSSTVGVNGCKNWANLFIRSVFTSVDSLKKMREFIWKNDEDPDRMFAGQVIKAVTGKNHWEL